MFGRLLHENVDGDVIAAGVSVRRVVRFSMCILVSYCLFSVVARFDADMANNEFGEFGDCDGANAEYVKLVSSDDHEFIIKRKYAEMSNTIKAMLSGPGQFEENQSNVIHFHEIPSHILKSLCAYFTYKAYYSESNNIPEFPIPMTISLELLMAANFLDC